MPVVFDRKRAVRRRLLSLALGVSGVLLVAAGPVAGVEPIDRRDPVSARRTTPPPVVVPPAPTIAPVPTTPPTPAPAPEPDPPGIDVSWPQCGDSLPTDFSFAIVGVNGGRVYKPNPCLGAGEQPSLLAWAGQDADLYLNTANPGPSVSAYWPHRQVGPRACDTPANPGADTTDCAYLYGWNAAADSYQVALEAFRSLGWADADATHLPGDRTWWLDVETANSWRGDWSLNVAALQGAVDFLESMDVSEVGFYSTPLLWWRVTGGTDAFADHPAWHAGASDRADAERRCVEEEAFTGGEVAMVQWVENDLDFNVRCEAASA